jgi:drug/metabolite transporter (DMT)-like permease
MAGRPAWRAPTAIGFVIFAWGAQIPFMDLLLGQLDPYWLSALRYGLAAPMLLGLIAVGHPPHPIFRQPGWPRLILLGGLGMAGFGTLYTLGIQLSGPVATAIILSFSPPLAGLIERVVLKQPFRPGTVLALVMGAIGGLVSVGDRLLAGAPVFDGGEPLLLIASALWYWYSAMGPRWFPALPNVVMTGYTLAAAAMTLAAIYAALWALGVAHAPGLPSGAPALATFGFVLVASTLAAITCWNLSVQAYGLALPALLLNLCPVVAVALAAAMGTPATPWQIAGGLVVIAGVVQMQLRSLMAAARTGRAWAADK